MFGNFMIYESYFINTSKPLEPTNHRPPPELPKRFASEPEGQR